MNQPSSYRYGNFSFFYWQKKHTSQDEVEDRINTILKKRYEELGPISWGEYSVALLFLIVVALWLTRDFSSFRGWDIIFRKE